MKRGSDHVTVIIASDIEQSTRNPASIFGNVAEGHTRRQKEGENVERQFKALEFDDRKQIAAMYASGAIASDIARKIGVSVSTIYTELKRGQDGFTLDKNFRPTYDPDLAQKRVQEALRRRGRRKRDIQP